MAGAIVAVFAAGAAQAQPTNTPMRRPQGPPARVETPRDGSLENTRQPRGKAGVVRPARIDRRMPSWARDSIGLHDVTLSINAQHSFRDYLAKEAPLVFVVSRHGRFVIWRYCRLGGRCTVAGAARAALAGCDRYRVDAPCYIYAVGRKVVWKGKVTQATSLGEVIESAENTTPLGPARAKGVLFYFRGYGPWPPGLHYNRVPPYVLGFARAGWDVKLVQVPHHNRPPRNLPVIDGLIRRVAAAAGREGYRRVVLAGHSRGAWEIIRAVNGAVKIHGVIMTSPAAHGTRFLSNGRRNLNFDRGNAAFTAILGSFASPRAAFAFFRNDSFMPANRVGLARDGLAAKPGVVSFVIDRPAGLPGHGAAWTRLFAQAWGHCLIDFMERASVKGFRCRPTRVKIDQPALVYTTGQLFELGARPMDNPAIRQQFTGVQLFAGADKRRASTWRFEADGRLVMHLAGNWLRGNTVRAFWEVRDNRVCVINSAVHGRRISCYTVFSVRPGVYAFVRTNRTVLMMYR